MQPPADIDWKETRLTGWGKGSRIVVAGFFAAAALLLIVYADAPGTGARLADGILWLMVIVFCHKIAAACFDRILWNDAAVRFAPVLGPQRCFDWSDLTDMQTEMKLRATVLRFGKWRRLRLLWSYDSYREIADLAERKLKNA